MSSNLHLPYTFPVVLLWTTNYILWDNQNTDLSMRDETNGEIINVFEDSNGDIQINITDEADNDIDGGGGVIMSNDKYSPDRSMEWDRIEHILTQGTPEEVTKLITDKALFIWDLCHER